MTAALEQALQSVPKWLMPALVVAIIALMLWNQNNERRFVVIEERMARNEERISNNVALIERVEKGLSATAAQHRAEDMSHTAQTREMLITDFEERVARTNARLDRIEQHLKATDDRIDALREAMPRR